MTARPRSSQLAKPAPVIDSLYAYVNHELVDSDVGKPDDPWPAAEERCGGEGAPAEDALRSADAEGALPLAPSLFCPKPHRHSLKGLLQRQARRRKLQEAEVQLEEADLRRMVQLLEEQAQFGGGGEADLRINYDGFAQVATECLASYGPQVGPFFQASTFLQFERDGDGAISLPLFVQYMSQHANAMQLRAQLCFYDEEGTGELGGPQLERYLADVAQELPLLASMEPWFLPHYTRITARKLLFFHGKRKCRGGEMRVRLSDLMVSPVMMELQELRALGLAAGAGGAPPDDRDLSSNWFSLQSAQRVYNTFNAWDADGNGTLSRAEFSRISQGTMSELFIARVFEEHAGAPRGGAWPPPPAAAPARRPEQRPGAGEGDASASAGPGSPDGLPRLGLRVRTPTQSGSGGGSGSGSSDDGGGAAPRPRLQSAAAERERERDRARRAPPAGACARDEMDMMAFVDFVLAWDHRNHPAALPYFFAIFDLRHKGYLSHPDLYTFFREIYAMWVAMGEYADLVVHDVLDEIVDMAAPARPGAITIKDLRECKMAGTVFSILANVDQFYQYNYRENFMHTGEGGAGGGQAAAGQSVGG